MPQSLQCAPDFGQFQYIELQDVSGWGKTGQPDPGAYGPNTDTGKFSAIGKALRPGLDAIAALPRSITAEPLVGLYTEVLNSLEIFVQALDKWARAATDGTANASRKARQRCQEAYESLRGRLQQAVEQQPPLKPALEKLVARLQEGTLHERNIAMVVFGAVIVAVFSGTMLMGPYALLVAIPLTIMGQYCVAETVELASKRAASQDSGASPGTQGQPEMLALNMAAREPGTDNITS